MSGRVPSQAGSRFNRCDVRALIQSSDDGPGTVQLVGALAHRFCQNLCLRHSRADLVTRHPFAAGSGT